MSHEAAHTHHITSPALLWATFIALVGLTLLTVAVASVPIDSIPTASIEPYSPIELPDPLDLSWLDMPITLVIATAKGLMHVALAVHRHEALDDHRVRPHEPVAGPVVGIDEALARAQPRVGPVGAVALTGLTTLDGTATSTLAIDPTAMVRTICSLRRVSRPRIANVSWLELPSDARR